MARTGGNKYFHMSPHDGVIRKCTGNCRYGQGFASHYSSMERAVEATDAILQLVEEQGVDIEKEYRIGVNNGKAHLAGRAAKEFNYRRSMQLINNHISKIIESAKHEAKESLHSKSTYTEDTMKFEGEKGGLTKSKKSKDSSALSYGALRGNEEDFEKYTYKTGEIAPASIDIKYNRNKGMYSVASNIEPTVDFEISYDENNPDKKGIYKLDSRTDKNVANMKKLQILQKQMQQDMDQHDAKLLEEMENAGVSHVAVYNADIKINPPYEKRKIDEDKLRADGKYEKYLVNRKGSERLTFKIKAA